MRTQELAFKSSVRNVVWWSKKVICIKTPWFICDTGRGMCFQCHHSHVRSTRLCEAWGRDVQRRDFLLILTNIPSLFLTLLAMRASCEEVPQPNCVKICFLSLSLNLLPVVLQCLLLLLESSSLVWTVNLPSFQRVSLSKSCSTRKELASCLGSGCGAVAASRCCWWF